MQGQIFRDNGTMEKCIQATKNTYLICTSFDAKTPVQNPFMIWAYIVLDSAQLIKTDIICTFSFSDAFANIIPRVNTYNKEMR